MKKATALFFTMLITSLSGFAQNQAVSPETTLSTSAPVAKSSSILDSVVLGYKSYNDSGRFGFQNQEVVADRKNPASKDAYVGRTYKGKHEAKLGYRHSTGWGLYGQMTQYRYDYSSNPNDNSKWSVSDPSITLTHPEIYSDSDLKVFGSLRYYLPLTDRSKLLNVRQAAYYLDSIYKFAQDQELFNEFNPRMFVQDTYGATDTRVKLEDITTYTRKIGTWGRYGAGQWTQNEQHADAPNGLTVDVYPFFDYMFTSKIFAGPRLYMPVMVQNSVYDGSRAATWENAYFELYLQASL